MTKNELVDQIAARTGLKKQEASSAVDALVDTVTETLKRGSEVTLSGFGKFHVADRAARVGVHPQTGAAIEIPASRVPRFAAGSALKSAIRGR